MTDEIFRKAQDLKKEMFEIETLQHYLNAYVFRLNIVDKKKVKVLARNFGNEYEIRFPKELQRQILNVVDGYMFDLKRTYLALGCEEKQDEST